MIRLILLIVLFLGMSAIGGLFVQSSLQTWYMGLVKAPFNPPPAVFGCVWSILYILLAYYMWKLYKMPQNNLTRKAKKLFILQLVLNFLWTPLFFGLQNSVLGMIDIILLDIVVLNLLFISKKLHRGLFAIMLIYFVWIVFATSLNSYIVIFN